MLITIDVHQMYYKILQEAMALIKVAISDDSRIRAITSGIIHS